MKIKLSIITNIAIFVMMIFGIIISLVGIPFMTNGSRSSFPNFIKYFTVQSNIFMGITAIAFAVNEILFLKKRIRINKILFVLKYIATVCVAITFFTVLFFLAPIVYRDYFFDLYVGTNFFYHLIIPLASMIIFIFAENSKEFNIKITIFGMIPFIIYSIFYVIASLTHMENGKVMSGYDWYGLIGFSYLISFLTYFLNKKLYKNNEED